MKWKRAKPGSYTSGPWTVQGSGTSWELLHEGDKAGEGASKKVCQELAVQLEEDEGQDPEPEPAELPSVPVERAPKSPKNMSANPPKYPLDSVIASLALQIDALNNRIASIDASQRKHAEATEGLTKAVLLLAKHVAKK